MCAHIAKEENFDLVIANEIFVSEAVSELYCSVFHYNTTFCNGVLNGSLVDASCLQLDFKKNVSQGKNHGI